MLEKIKSKLAVGLAGLFFLTIFPLPCLAFEIPLKDISHIKGIRDNELVGYGVVVGLQKTGDKSRSTQMAQKNLLMNFGSVVQNTTDIKNDNSAAVIVTATLPPFAKGGDRIDVTVSSMADAKSLEGGVLVETQLLAPNGQVVALAQGPISTGGTSASAAGSSKRTAITTSGRIPNGAIVEMDMHTQIGDSTGFDVVLNHSDFTMAEKVADLINSRIAPAYATDGGTIRVQIPETYLDNRVPMIAAVQNLMIDPGDSNNDKVVVNERTGTIVIGSDVHLRPAAIAQGGITVSIQATNSVSQPGALSNGGTVGYTNAKINIDKKPGALVQLNSNATLQDLVSALNALGATPSDLISILQALKAAGSLQATLQII